MYGICAKRSHRMMVEQKNEQVSFVRINRAKRSHRMMAEPKKTNKGRAHKPIDLKPSKTLASIDG